MTILVTSSLRMSPASAKISRARGRRFGDATAHADVLRALTGEDQRELGGAGRGLWHAVWPYERRVRRWHYITAWRERSARVDARQAGERARRGMRVILASPIVPEGAVRGRDLLSIAELSPDEVEQILRTALSLKRDGGGDDLLRGKTLALLFEKPSLRTRVSFDVAMQELGGHAIYLSQAEVGLGQRESVADVSRVLSRYVDVIAARTYSHETLLDLARHADVPVINALSDEEHPCQALADLLTVLERFGTLRGVRLAFIGDGFNVAASLAEACGADGRELRDGVAGRATACRSRRSG